MKKKLKPAEGTLPVGSRLTGEAPLTDAAVHKLKLTEWVLCSVAFASGAATLVIELAGNRLLAPLFGNSLYTWTSLIGVVLVAISVGDYLGGSLVDRMPRMAVLGYLLLIASAATLLVPPLNEWCRQAFASADVISGPIIVSLVLFAVPACLLAAVCPFIVRLLSRTTNDRNIGLSAGLVGMLATLGSFVGTFASGFFLIPVFGVRQIFLFTGVIVGALGLLAVFAFRDEKSRPSPALPLLVLAPLALALMDRRDLPPNVIFEQDTFYHEITVEEYPGPGGADTRVLKLDTTVEGAQEVASGKLVLPYQEYWRLTDVLNSKLDRACFLGGGGFGMPQQLSKHRPQAAIDVVEIDPKVIEVGRKYFRLGEFPKVTPHAADARRWLLTHDAKHDLIFGDAYNGLRYVPAHLVTSEFFALVKSRLADEGVFMMNLLSAAEGPRAKLFQSLIKTLEPHFKHVVVFGTANTRPGEVQNLIVVAADVDLEAKLAGEGSGEDATRLKGLLATRLDAKLHTGLTATPLTDDYNPVEYLVARQTMEK